MNIGRIKCFFQARGYGYIEDFDGREIYFHLAVVEPGMHRGIMSGAEVYFEAITTGMGLEALRVRPA